MTGPLPYRIVRSERRVKTVAARVKGDHVEVRVPASMSDADARSAAESLRDRLDRRIRAGRVDLAERALELAAAHDLPAPTRIEFVGNQQHRWGSASPHTGEIRVSDRLAGLPPWVLDYVIVHELAHLVHADHSPAFWQLVDRYPLAERARGFLMGVDHRAAPDDGPAPCGDP